jgi:uncharacterized protein with von Willebrand factor type A (vWA) domain
MTGLPRPTSDPLADFDGSTFVRNAVLFTRALRSAGVATDLGGALDFARALTLVDLGDRAQVHAVGSALFCRRHADLAVYEAVFDEFWRRHSARIAPTGLESDARRRVPGALDPEASRDSEHGRDRVGPPRIRHARAEPTTGAEGQAGAAGRAVSPRAFSPGEAFLHREFDRMTAAELLDAEHLVDLLRPRLEAHLTRRYALHPHGRRLAPRAMFRRNLGAGGDLVDWVWLRRLRRPRSIVILCDVSGSMERHARILLRFVQALTRASGVRTESFVFGTRLTRITHELRGRDPDAAIRRVSETVSDWSGGTRIGDAFRTFNLRWARRVLRTSGVVIVVSDGWDRGDPELVGAETARLQRNSHRLIWLNPLAGAEGYRPIAAGMAAAYPSIDDFLPIQSIASLEQLGEVLGGLGLDSSGRPPRTGTPRVHRLADQGHARRPAAGSVQPLVAALPRPAAATPVVPGAARPLPDSRTRR